MSFASADRHTACLPLTLKQIVLADLAPSGARVAAATPPYASVSLRANAAAGAGRLVGVILGVK